ncbi:MAG: prepilin peptidase [Candidatus Omnitrophica bacterium]|nr:prepilin peptidase [Candidatus Omnitrophota bacterium]MCA9417660.1 prepilin peptidase [Candidatus Omnitrophota bacterium]MCA9448526.1 prepilin peptidase [Candidatus Omnitrophota bacterium]MCB9768268.1 prepilin peptidase [Candidatus Omnitrophota bacterium]
MPTSPTLLGMELNPLEFGFGLAASFAAGACIGSFLNVCIYRWPLGMSTNDPKRSRCFNCKQEIPWYDNLPIISWFLLGGKCRQCGASFSIRYSMVELLNALLFLHIFWTFGLTAATAVYFLWAAMQVVGSFIDIDHTIIPDRITLTGTILFPLLVIVLNLSGHSESLVVSDWRDALFGAAFASGFIYLIRFLGTIAFGREAMGLGDVKLMAMNGALLGWWRSLFVIMGLGPALALLVVGVAWVISRKKMEKFAEIPFGPYLCLGSYVALFWANSILEWWLGLDPGSTAHLDSLWRRVLGW